MFRSVKLVGFLAASLALGLLAQTNTATARTWTFYTYAAVPTTAAVKGIKTIAQ